MSNTVSLQAFLAGKSFLIPAYQRDYSWTPEEVGELFIDIQDAIDTNTSHYFGTLVLAQTGTAFEIVDGQQRLSTIVLLVHALLAQLDPADRIRIADEVFLLNNGATLKLDFGSNRAFVTHLLAAHTPTPTTGGQRRLEKAYQLCLERARVIRDTGSDAAIHTWLQAIKNLELIAFSESDTGRAIRTFQSVNDRGRPLTYMDKAKALLVLYSNRCLSGGLDDRINLAFGACFEAYDRLRELASESGYAIELISRATFSEDEILRYHYLAYDHREASDYYGSRETILDDFLKPGLRARQRDPSALQEFISEYVEDLQAFAQAFASLVGATRSDARLFTLLVVHRLAARLYPIVTRLYQRNLLFCPVQGAASAIDLLHCLEIVDLRVYKLRGTDPARDIGHLSHSSRNASVADIAERLLTFVREFMPDGLMQTQLEQPMYKNGATVPALLAFEQSLGQPYNLQQLVGLVQRVPTQEHILAQRPAFNCTAYGFADDTDFHGQVDRIGNLALLAEDENARCLNKSVQQKMSSPDLYRASVFAGPRHLAAQFAVNREVFGRKEVLARTEELARFALRHWPIW